MIDLREAINDISSAAVAASVETMASWTKDHEAITIAGIISLTERRFCAFACPNTPNGGIRLIEVNGINAIIDVFHVPLLQCELVDSRRVELLAREEVVMAMEQGRTS